jgi:hypothetical protein
VGLPLSRLYDHKHWTHTHSVGLIWTGDQPHAEASAWQHTTLTRERCACPPVGFAPVIPSSEWQQTHALDRVATGIGKDPKCMHFLSKYVPYFMANSYFRKSNLNKTHCFSRRRKMSWDIFSFSFKIQLQPLRSLLCIYRQGVISRFLFCCCEYENIYGRTEKA